jgi:predicted dehydrogenase/threonine dehydrogenase-like Zn-dependent dehydrogenase
LRQILCNSSGALVTRQPRPALRAGTVLVRVHFSLVSAGTELAALRREPIADGSTIERAAAYTELARRYLGKAWHDPRKAAQRVKQIARQQANRLLPPKPRMPAPHFALDQFQWTTCAAKSLRAEDGCVELETDESPSGYQIMSQPIALEKDRLPLLRLTGRVHEGGVSVGLLNEDRSQWLGTHAFGRGEFADRLCFDPKGSQSVTVVVTNDGTHGTSRVTLDSIDLAMVPPTEDGLPQSELDDQGWNVGYSAAGEVLAVGEGVEDLAVGDLVACAGAGYANHADYVCVPRNLVARVPEGCDLQVAASTTVGTIALQGVRRAQPQLGETVAVLGLGLIGQITAQLLTANGCRVVGFDLQAGRVARAKKLGMACGTSDREEFTKLIRDLTGGRGVDRTLITAATKSDAVINQAMEITRAKGTVVIVGDVGLKVERASFYRKEIDLLMSTSYGPGRYDSGYEEEGQDYPYAYVRWSLNRNMQAYLDLCATGKLQVGALVDRVVSVDEAPSAYRALADAQEDAPLGVLLRYPEEPGRGAELPSAPAIHVRGHRPAPSGPLKYALVGMGGFGVGMLVPQMQKRPERFFLRAVVSRNASTAGNFARTNRVEILATELNTVLDDPQIDLVVLATRHHEHAEQVAACLKAGKHVFVEKPLAITWEQLDEVTKTYDRMGEKPAVMVGFNRRFSPALELLREQLAERRSPVMVNYRLHGGYIALDHWVQGAQGGGRNLGEACHMYDVFRSLAGAPVKSIAATAIDPRHSTHARNDNFAATISYADGSVGNLFYTALGPKQGLPKERIEVFCDGESYLVDDFKRLVRASDQAVLWQSSEADKGHFTELSRLGDALARGEDAPLAWEEIVETTAVALHVEDLLKERV